MIKTIRNNKKINLIFFVICYIAYSSIYIARLNFSVASVLLEEARILTKSEIGIIGSIFSLTYAVSKIPAGYLGDRFPSSVLIGTGLLISGLSNLVIGIWPNFISICIFWFLNACGQAVLWGPVLRTVQEIYGFEIGRRLSKLMSSSVAAGSILGLLIASNISAPLGISMCFFIPAAITITLAIIVIVLIPGEKDREYHYSFNKSDEKQISIRELLRDRKFIIIAFPSIFHGIIKDNINVWIAVYFVNTFGIDVSAIAGYVFLAPLLGLVGRLLFPILSEALHGKDVLITTAGFIVSSVTILILIFNHAAIWAIIAFGIISAMVSLVNVYFLAVFPMSYSECGGLAFVASIMDVLTYGGAGIGSLCFGFMISKWGFSSMFIIWLIVSTLSIIFMIAFKRYTINNKA